MKPLAAAILLVLLASPLLAGESTVPPEKVQEALRLLREKQARHPLAGQVLIKITRIEHTKQVDRVRELAARLGASKVIVEGGNITPGEGLVVKGRQQGRFYGGDAAGRFMDSKTQGSQITVQTLLAQVGKPARFSVLTTSVDFWDIGIPIENEETIQTLTIEEVVGTGVELVVRSANPQTVTVELAPLFFRRLPKGAEKKRFTTEVEELMTTVTLPTGGSVQVAAQDEFQHQGWRSIFSNKEQGGHRSVEIYLSASLMEPPQ